MELSQEELNHDKNVVAEYNLTTDDIKEMTPEQLSAVEHLIQHVKDAKPVATGHDESAEHEEMTGKENKDYMWAQKEGKQHPRSRLTAARKRG